MPKKLCFIVRINIYNLKARLCIMPFFCALKYGKIYVEENIKGGNACV